MLGTNPVRKFQHESRSLIGLQVQDIWSTIQGEGHLSGQRALFIRLTGCNLRCTFCDALWDDVKDPYMLEDDILARALSVSPHRNLVVITGGEPLIQSVAPLVKMLLDKFKTVQFETAGTVWRKDLELFSPTRLHFVVSPKTPEISEEWYERATKWKYPLRAGCVAEDDGLPMINTQIATGTARRLARPPASVPRASIYLTPIHEGNEHPEMNRANIRAVADSAMRFGYTASVQLHRYLEVA